MTVRFLEIAEIELDEAINWYGEQAPGLGDAFLIEVLSELCAFPKHGIRWEKASAVAASAVSPMD